MYFEMFREQDDNISLSTIYTTICEVPSSMWVIYPLYIFIPPEPPHDGEMCILTFTTTLIKTIFFKKEEIRYGAKGPSAGATGPNICPEASDFTRGIWQRYLARDQLKTESRPIGVWPKYIVIIRQQLSFLRYKMFTPQLTCQVNFNIYLSFAIANFIHTVMFCKMRDIVVHRKNIYEMRL